MIRLRAMSFLVICTSVLLAPFAQAQYRAQVQGTVTDTSGAVVPGAKVTVQNQETGRTLQVTTSSAGFYNVSSLAPGKYRVTVEAPNFKKEVTNDVEVSAETPRGFDVRLQPGATSESVEVNGGVADVETENANIGRNISTQEVLRLPQTGRDVYNLVRLTPGVFGDAARQGNGNSQNLPNQGGTGGSNSQIFQVENEVQVIANGQRVSANSFQLDGVSINSLGNPGAAVLTPNEESVKELQVVSNPFSAEYGRNSGAQIQVISQNGTNQFHGSGAIKFNDAGLNAFNKYYGRTDVPLRTAPITCETGTAHPFTTLAQQCPGRVDQKYRQFAGSVGGPIWKNKLFFFASYEGVRSNASKINRNIVIETNEFRQYVISKNPNSLAAKLFNTPGVAPRVASITSQTDCCSFDTKHPLGTWYLPGATVGNDIGGGPDGIPDWAVADINAPGSSVGDQFNGRVDYNRGNNQFFVSGYVTRKDDLAGGNRPIEDITTKPTNSTATVSWTRVISSALLNEARVNFTRFAYNQVNSLTNWGIPNITVMDTDLGGTFGNNYKLGASRGSTTPAKLAQNTYEFRDQATWIWGRHGFKLGGQYRREQDNNQLIGGARPAYQFRGLLNLANDACCRTQNIDVDPTTGGVPNAQRYFRMRDVAGYVQDDWKFSPTLTLNLGVRYEYFSPPSENLNRISNYIFGTQGLVNGSVQTSSQLYHPDRTNFAPRIGFAWLPYASSNRLVLRGGFGIQYDRPFGSVFTNIRQNTPYFATTNIGAFNTPPPAGTPILYAFGSSNSPFSYPVNTGLAFGVAPDGALCANKACSAVTTVDLFGALPNEPTPYIYSYALGMEYAFAPSYVLNLGYQGSNSHKLIRTVDLNRLIPGATFGINGAANDPTKHMQIASADGVACGPNNPACLAPHLTGNPRFARIFIPLPDVNASYNSLIARFAHRYSHGLQAEATYTWSKSIDTSSFENGQQQMDPSNQKLERGPSDYDVTNSFSLAALWDVPLFRERKDFLGKVVGGWQISSIISKHSGFPFTPVIFGPTNNDPNGDGFRPDRPQVYVGGVIADPSKQQFINGIFPGSLARGSSTIDPSFGNLNYRGTGTVGRNSFRGPGYFDVDMSLDKRFGLPNAPFIGEGANLDFRANLFNAFNILNLAPISNFSDITNLNNFGRSQNGLSGRVVEFQLRLGF